VSTAAGSAVEVPIGRLIVGAMCKHLLQPSKKYTSKMVTKEMSKDVHAKAAPFIQWLKEAEEESSNEDGEGDESDEDVEVITCTAQHACCKQVVFLAASVCLSVCPQKILKMADQKSM